MAVPAGAIDWFGRRPRLVPCQVLCIHWTCWAIFATAAFSSEERGKTP